MVVVGVALAIGLAWVLGEIYRSGIISTTTNSQIVSRVSPRLVDLYAALGAGAVGAFATCRKDIGDTLPGAAIAIALVPPLAVVGLTLSQGAWGEAWGVMLLFLTNFFAILVSGSIVFALVGLSAAATGHLEGHHRRRAFQVIIIGAMLVAVPLAVTSLSTLRAARLQNQVRTAAEDWVVGSEYEVLTTTAKTGSVVIEITGSGETPPRVALIDEIREVVDGEVSVSLQIIPSQKEEFTLY